MQVTNFWYCPLTLAKFDVQSHLECSLHMGCWVTVEPLVTILQQVATQLVLCHKDWRYLKKAQHISYCITFAFFSCDLTIIFSLVSIRETEKSNSIIKQAFGWEKLSCFSAIFQFLFNFTLEMNPCTYEIKK